jgi:hypothetical protein
VLTDMAALLLGPKQLCRILFFVFFVLFLTLLAHHFGGVITYSRKNFWISEWW